MATTDYLQWAMGEHAPKRIALGIKTHADIDKWNAHSF